MIGAALGVVLDGLDAIPIQVEADVSRGLPSFAIVGLPDSAVSESKQRIRAAIQNAGLQFPRERITVNLSPASVRKRGAGLDLAIAIAILRAERLIPDTSHADLAFCAELNLSGALCAVEGITQLALGLRRTGVTDLLVPVSCHETLLKIPGLACYDAHTLEDVVVALRSGELSSHPWINQAFSDTSDDLLDFQEVRGLESVKRGMEIAAVGAHHVMLVGPPGSGKSMLAERMHGILPLLTDEEAISTYAIHQAAGQTNAPSHIPPSRMPHHSITRAGLLGGGQPVMPGEVTLAHQGVLILDEFLEFSQPTVQALREPLTAGNVRLARTGKHITLPAKFQLIATMNPCPCGFYGYGDCGCGEHVIAKYWRKISGPILDRIDISLSVSPEHTQNTPSTTAKQSIAIRERITAAQARLTERETWLNQSSLLQRQTADFSYTSSQLMERLSDHLLLSGRGKASLVRISRSISALAGTDSVLPEHVQEAAGLRAHTGHTAQAGR